MKKIGCILLLGTIAGLLAYYGQGMYAYMQFRNEKVRIINTANAGIPQQNFADVDAGKITKVMKCIYDTPVIAPVKCTLSCPLMDMQMAPLCAPQIASVMSACPSTPACAPAIVAAQSCMAACGTHTELTTTSQYGSTFIAVPPGFLYTGGGTMPSPGMDFIYAGHSNMLPEVIGIPSASAMRIIRLADAYAATSEKVSYLLQKIVK